MAAAEWRRKSHDICMQLQQCDRVLNARMILSYVSFRQEPDLVPLLTSLAQGTGHRLYGDIQNKHRQFALPRCQGKTLIWHLWHPHQASSLVTGAYGILEPNPSWPTVTPQSLAKPSILLVPAVACDRQGYRIGYGGGFYDRMLVEPAWASVIKIGIVFDFAYVDALPTDPWDQTLSGVCTDKGLTLFRDLDE